MDDLQFKLEDFFPIYTKSDDDIVIKENLKPLYESIIFKKEFDDSRAVLNEPFPERGEQLKHQAFMARFMSPYTPYDKMIAFHGLGSGKASTLLGLAEYAKYVSAGELSSNKVIVLTRNPTLRKALINELACVTTVGKYEPPLRDEKTKELLSKDTQRKRVERSIKVEYEVLTFTMFVKEIYSKSDEQLKKEYSNRYILIDEAHNIKLQPEKRKVRTDDDILGLQLSSRGISNYKEIHRLLHVVTGCKILLLTATPMRDQPSEICNLLNLLLPLNKQLNKKEFKKKYFEGNSFKESEKLNFKYLTRNLVSYLRSSTTDIVVVNEGDIDLDRNIKYTKTVRLEMEDEQEEKYKEAYKLDSKKYKNMSLEDEVDDDADLDEDDNSQALWNNSRQASLFTSFNNDEKLNSLIKQDGVIYKPTEKLIKYLKEKGDDFNSMLSQLKKCSIKYWFVVRDIFKYQDQKFFIYSNIVKGSGALLLGAILQVFGMIHAPILKGKEGTKYCQEKPTISNERNEDEMPMNKNPNRMLVLTGSTLSANQLDIMVNDIFNAKENRYGDYIRVIIGSHIVGEGISFKHIRRMYVLTPAWNNGTTEQAIGRAIRFKSHNDLPPDKRTVSIFRVAAEPMLDISRKAQLDSIDMQMYKISEDKDIVIKQVERLLKESAIDCALNRSRNLLPTDLPNTKECDYMENCAYQCDLVDERYYHSNWVGDRIVDTYNLYYAEKEINIVKKALREAYQYKFAYDFEELYIRISEDIKGIPSIVLARALDSMISNNEKIMNKYGLTNYLREDRNMFFLVDDPLAPSIFTSYYYSANPVPENSIGSFEEILEFFQYDKINNVLDSLIKYQNNSTVLNKIFNNLSIQIIQKFIELFFIANLNKSNFNKELQDFIIEKYSIYITKISGNYILTINPNNHRILYKGKKEWDNLTEEERYKIENVKEDKLNILRNNEYGIYAVISDKYKSSKDQHKNLKLVEINEKKSFGGTSCSTKPFNLEALIGVYYNIVKKSIIKGVKPPILGEEKYNLKTFKTLKMYDTLVEHIKNLIYVRKLKNIIMKVEKTDLEDFVNTVKLPKEKKNLNNILDKQVLDEDDYLNFVKTSEASRLDLVNRFYDKGEKDFLKEVDTEVKKEIDSLSKEEINYIGNIISGKSSPKICNSLKDWFKENDLYIIEEEGK